MEPKRSSVLLCSTFVFFLLHTCLSYSSDYKDSLHSIVKVLVHCKNLFFQQFLVKANVKRANNNVEHLIS